MPINSIEGVKKTKLEASKVRGRLGGRHNKLGEDQAQTLRRMYDFIQHAIKEICKLLNIGRPSSYRYLNA
jgi:DNA invertase Pin-like site-specific DNA recombinase